MVTSRAWRNSRATHRQRVSTYLRQHSSSRRNRVTDVTQKERSPMGKDLVRRTSKPERTDVAKPERTEVDEARRALAERMLFGSEPRPQPAQDRARIILALDCTSSMGEF